MSISSTALVFILGLGVGSALVVLNAPEALDEPITCVVETVVTERASKTYHVRTGKIKDSKHRKDKVVVFK